MFRPARYHSSLFVLAFSLLLTLLLALPESVSAQGMQPRGGPPGRGMDPNRKPSTPTSRPSSNEPQWKDTGRDFVRILKYEPVKDSSEEDLLGYVTVKALAKGAKALKLRVRKGEDVRVEINGQAIDPEKYGDLPWKGLCANAEWGKAYSKGGGDKKSKSSSKEQEIQTLNFETITVEGAIESIEGDTIVIKAKPTNDQDWPNTSPTPKTGTTEKKVPFKKLKLKILEGITQFAGGKGGSLELTDFQVGQDVEASVSCGIKLGLLSVLKAPGVEGTNKEGGNPSPGRGGGELSPPGGRGNTGPRGRGI